MNTNTRFDAGSLALLPALFLLSCSTPGTKPEDMSAAAHKAAATEHHTEAGEQGDGLRGHRAAEGHEALARAHAKAAVALETYEAGVCGQFPAATRAMCPLMAQLKSVADIDGGVFLVPTDGVDLESWTAQIQCHVAYAATAGHIGMDECPLFARGVRVEKVPGGVNLVIGAGGADPADVAKLRAAARTHL